MKQTAVEWLIEQLVKMDKELDGRRKNEDATVLRLNPTKLLEQAKAMEKEQIEKAYSQGALDSVYMPHKYYNETYGQGSNDPTSPNN
jgi:hypothetical protein